MLYTRWKETWVLVRDSKVATGEAKPVHGRRYAHRECLCVMSVEGALRVRGKPASSILRVNWKTLTVMRRTSRGFENAMVEKLGVRVADQRRHHERFRASVTTDLPGGRVCLTVCMSWKNGQTCEFTVRSTRYLVAKHTSCITWRLSVVLSDSRSCKKKRYAHRKTLLISSRPWSACENEHYDGADWRQH